MQMTKVTDLGNQKVTHFGNKLTKPLTHLVILMARQKEVEDPVWVSDQSLRKASPGFFPLILEAEYIYEADLMDEWYSISITCRTLLSDNTQVFFKWARTQDACMDCS